MYHDIIYTKPAQPVVSRQHVAGDSAVWSAKTNEKEKGISSFLKNNS
jgi:hypothetical protein